MITDMSLFVPKCRHNKDLADLLHGLKKKLEKSLKASFSIFIVFLIINNGQNFNNIVSIYIWLNIFKFSFKI